MNRKLICLLTLLWTAVGGVKAQDIFVTEVTPNTEYTFTMPAQDVEVTTALYYRLKEGADNTAIYTELGSTSPVDVFLERLLVAGEWNTIALPFDIAEADMETVFGTGLKLYHPASVPASIKAFRAYFKLIGSAEKARTIYLDLGDKSTSICEMQYGGGQTVSHSTYDLSGRVVSGKLNKGVYIRDGRKMVIK